MDGSVLLNRIKYDPKKYEALLCSCPFHGWIFSGETGKCTRIPYNIQSIPEQAKVSVWPVVERNRHIYVWFHCDGKEPNWEVPEIEEVENGQQLTLLRSEAGKVYLIDSYCPHLGASFSVGGRVVDDNSVSCLQCPFHGWIFSGETGKCTRIPYNIQSIPEQAKVSVWPVVERNRHIYVWFHCDGKEPNWEVPEIEEVENGEWPYQGRTEHEILCHIQDLPENGSDIAHLNYLHLAGVNKGNDITKIKMEIEDPLIRHVWDGRWEPQPEPNEHIAIMYLEQVMTIMKMRIPLTSSNLCAKQIGPGIVQMMFDFGWLGKGVVMHHVTPEEPMFQRARFVMYATLPKLFAKFFLISEANHFERDIFVWTNKRYVRPPVLVKNDGPIGRHRRWYSQFYSENSPKLNRDGTLTNQPKSIFDW
ncbi:3-ketosteroid-9-alpha-monooxygenase oxygenase subunit [Toxocara canis]|uniref:cholesterol 7-desaturase n=1 Tax=Toxocara canis TaxID=6265 RepID=A0A0B2VZZ5_TOXCA|nr:3-ketosteroid-9-alpha-monooxygenase oxygenase subunit [Toxocara canis]